MSQTSESKPAGMWRPIELTDGDIIKLFQSGEHGEANYRQFDGRWYVLDESPEAIAEARQADKLMVLNELLVQYRDAHEQLVKANDRLTAENAKLREQRDRLLEVAKWAEDHFKRHTNLHHERLSVEIAAIESESASPDVGRDEPFGKFDENVVNKAFDQAMREPLEISVSNPDEYDDRYNGKRTEGT